MTEYHVGQKVIVVGVNDRGRPPQETTITKVGRKLVYLADRWGRDEAYRIESRTINDKYGQFTFYTEEQYAARQERKQIRERLAAHQVHDLSSIGLTNDQLSRIADIIEEGKTND